MENRFHTDPNQLAVANLDKEPGRAVGHPQSLGVTC